MSKLTFKSLKVNIGLSSDKSKGKAIEIIKLPSSISAHPPKEVLEKSKFFRKGIKSMAATSSNSRKLYAQITSSIIETKQNLILR